MNIGETISYLRKNKKMSQEELANQLFLTRQAISNYERNITTPNIEILQKLATSFNMTVDELTNFKVYNYKKMKYNKYLFIFSMLLILFIFIVTIFDNFKNIGALISSFVITAMCGGQFYWMANTMIKNNDYTMLAGYKPTMDKEVLKKQLLTMIFYSQVIIIFYDLIITLGLFIHFDSNLFFILTIVFVFGWIGNLLVCSFKYKQ